MVRRLVSSWLLRFVFVFFQRILFAQILKKISPPKNNNNHEIKVGATSAIIAAAEDPNINGLIAENPLTRPEELLTFLYSNGFALSFSLLHLPLS